MPRPSTPTGNNNRRIGVAHAILAPGLRAWMESYGGMTAFAERIDCDPSIPRKIVAAQITIPEKYALEWPAKLRLKGAEADDIAAAVALSSASVHVLQFFDSDWQARVERLGDRLKRYAAKRAPTST